MKQHGLKVAIASSGLGHVARGIETWALDTAAALTELGVDVTLFAAGEIADKPNQQSNQCSDPPVLQSCAFREVVLLSCMRRFDAGTRKLARMMPQFMWRWGLKSAYGWEEFTFWLRLWPRLCRGRFDVLHVQDSWLAYWCRQFRKLGLVKTKEILGHGTQEPVEWLAQFEYVQHLAPYHREQALESLKSLDQAQASGVRKKKRSSIAPRPHWVSIPNFVDTEMFRPAYDAAEKAECREAFGIPLDAFVIGTAATVKKPHKRIDYLIREFAEHLKCQTLCGPDSTYHISDQSPELQSSNHPSIHRPHLLVAGARTPQSGKLVAMAESMAPGHIAFLFDLPRERMPAFYRSLDVFMLVSLFEMMPIAVLEALSSGLPVVANRIPQLQWIIGDNDAAPPRGGICLDMSRRGAVIDFLGNVKQYPLDVWRKHSRQRVEAMFSRNVVARMYVEYYLSVTAG